MSTFENLEKWLVDNDKTKLNEWRSHMVKEAFIGGYKSALEALAKCEPVAEAIRERDRLGFAVVNVIGKLDEIIDATQEVEIDDFLHIAVPIDMWNDLQESLEDMPKRADLYTSPQPRDWVDDINKRLAEFDNKNKPKPLDLDIKYDL